MQARYPIKDEVGSPGSLGVKSSNKTHISRLRLLSSLSLVPSHYKGGTEDYVNIQKYPLHRDLPCENENQDSGLSRMPLTGTTAQPKLGPQNSLSTALGWLLPGLHKELEHSS